MHLKRGSTTVLNLALILVLLAAAAAAYAVASRRRRNQHPAPQPFRATAKVEGYGPSLPVSPRAHEDPVTETLPRSISARADWDWT